ALDLEPPPVLEIAQTPTWRNARMTRPERAILKSAVTTITARQEPVPYRELLNQVYMELVDKKVDFDSARQIETTLLNHNGREILLIEEADETETRVLQKWWLGEQQVAPEKARRIPFLGKITRLDLNFHARGRCSRDSRSHVMSTTGLMMGIATPNSRVPDTV